MILWSDSLEIAEGDVPCSCSSTVLSCMQFPYIFQTSWLEDDMIPNSLYVYKYIFSLMMVKQASVYTWMWKNSNQSYLHNTLPSIFLFQKKCCRTIKILIYRLILFCSAAILLFSSNSKRDTPFIESLLLLPYF